MCSERAAPDFTYVQSCGVAAQFYICVELGGRRPTLHLCRIERAARLPPTMTLVQNWASGACRHTLHLCRVGGSPLNSTFVQNWAGAAQLYICVELGGRRTTAQHDTCVELTLTRRSSGATNVRNLRLSLRTFVWCDSRQDLCMPASLHVCLLACISAPLLPYLGVCQVLLRCMLGVVQAQLWFCVRCMLAAVQVHLTCAIRKIHLRNNYNRPKQYLTHT